MQIFRKNISLIKDERHLLFIETIKLNNKNLFSICYDLFK